MEDTKIVDYYEKALRIFYIITTPLQDILNGKLDTKARLWQLLYIMIWILYVIPRYTFLSCLYLASNETREFYQYWLADYFDFLGVFGRTLNLSYLVYTYAVVLDKVILRSHETTGTLEFLTDMITLKSVESRPGSSDGESASTTEDTSPKVEAIDVEDTSPKDETIDSDDKKRLMASIKLYTRLALFGCFSTTGSINLYDILACPWYLYHVNPHWKVYLVAILNFCILLVMVQMSVRHIFGLYLSLIVTTDYFQARISTLLKHVQSLKVNFIDENLYWVLTLYDLLMIDFKRQNATVRSLLRNLVYFYCAELSLVFFIFTIEMNIWFRLIMLATATLLSISIMITGIYVGQLRSQVMHLYEELNHVNARSVVSGKRRFTSFKARLHLRLAIKELGQNAADGQFVVGLTDGKGAATSSLEMFNLTLQTISYTFMFIQMSTQ